MLNTESPARFLTFAERHMLVTGDDTLDYTGHRNTFDCTCPVCIAAEAQFAAASERMDAEWAALSPAEQAEQEAAIRALLAD